MPGWPEYEVSTLGRVRSWRPHNSRRRLAAWLRSTHGPRLLRPSIRKASGYAFVGLVGEGRRQRDVGVHRLVLEAFVGPCPPGMQTRHLNGVRHDNRMSNLRWGTPAENGADKVRHGTAFRGEAHPNAKLTEEKVRSIRERRAAGMTWAALAREFRVTEGAARGAGKGGWKHVE